MSTVIGKLLVLALVLGAGLLVNVRLVPWIAGRVRRLLRMREISPVTTKRIARFKRLRRGYWAFLALTTLFTLSLLLEFLVNGRALVVHYEDRTAFPAVAEWASKALFFANISFFEKKSDFGQIGESEVDYHRFARDCRHPEELRAELDAARTKIAADRAELAGDAAPKTTSDRMKAAAKEKSLKRREAELVEIEKAHTAFAGGRAWCIMPLYETGPSEFRHDLEERPPNNPSFAHGIPLGTDEAGRDVLVLLVYGFRISLAFSLLVWAVGYVVGIAVGSIQGYYGSWVDIGLQRIEEIWGSIPFLYTIMIIASLKTPTFLVLLGIMIVLVSWLGITTYMRAEVYREKAKDYVQAAIGCGVSDWKIMVRHILPNALVPIVTFAPFTIVGYITLLVSLDYLGFGLPVGTPNWGNLLKQGQESVQFHPHLITVPSVALMLTLMALVFVGEAVREAFDPKVFSRLR